MQITNKIRVVTLLVLTIGCPMTAIAATFHEMETPSGLGIFRVSDISDDGFRASGIIFEMSGPNAVALHGAVWSTSDGAVALNDAQFAVGDKLPDNSTVVPRAISGNGLAIAGIIIDRSANGPGTQGFSWTELSGFDLLSIPAGTESVVDITDVSQDGNAIIGHAIAESASLTITGHLWIDDSQPLELPDLPGGQNIIYPIAISADGSVVVGASRSELGPESFRWTKETGTVALGGPYSGQQARDVSDDGSVIVGLVSSIEVQPSGLAGYRWTEKTGFQTLTSEFDEIIVSEVSGDGSVIVGQGRGVTSELESDHFAFVWHESIGVRRLQNLLPGLGVPAEQFAGWQLEEATAISSDGLTIVGNGINPTGKEQGWILRLDHPIPEPSSVVLAACGLMALMSRRRF